MKFTLYAKFIGPKINADKLPPLPEFSEVHTYLNASADNVNAYMPEDHSLPQYQAIDRYLDWLLEHQPTVYAAGAEKTVIYYTYWANCQGNTEFSAEQIRKISTLGAGLAVTCASLEEE